MAPVTVYIPVLKGLSRQLIALCNERIQQFFIKIILRITWFVDLAFFRYPLNASRFGGKRKKKAGKQEGWFPGSDRGIRYSHSSKEKSDHIYDRSMALPGMQKDDF